VRRAQSTQPEILPAASIKDWEGFDMFSTIFGTALVVVTCAFYWYLLPRNGRVHPLVRNSNVGSWVTVTIMTVLTFGVVILFQGLFDERVV
jgi:hypothetical protein